MKLLNPGFDLERFFGRLELSVRNTLLLDYDGTLAPFRIRRDEALPYPGVRRALEDIIEGGKTRVVLVTGRSVENLVPLLGLSRAPEIWGSHGWERMLPDGTYRAPKPAASMVSGLSEAYAWAAETGISASCERKPGCLALHWRGMDPADAEMLRSKAEEKWRGIAEGSGLTLREFNGGIELRPADTDKGAVVIKVLAESKIGAPAAYLGDDSTDEDAFRALGRNDLGVLVSEESRATAADVWIRPPEELLGLLHRWAGAPGGITWQNS